MELEKLPPDVLELTFSFLTGYDAFFLSHTSSWLLRHLSDDSFWRERLPPAGRFEDQEKSNKRRYVKARSLLFADATPEHAKAEESAPVEGKGLQPSKLFARLRGVNGRGAARTWATIGGVSNFAPGYDLHFSFSLWFALLPATDERPIGGILFGMQSSEASSQEWPHYHQQIVVVDSQRNLYCSVLDTSEVVASNLEHNRWYHIALTYDIDFERQDVYVDGTNVWSTTGGLHHEWGRLTFEQIGTGCITADDHHFPHPGDIGWYPFNGIIDDFRLNYGALSTDETAGLASSGSAGEWDTNGALRPPEDPQRADGWANADFVRCTRPAEGKQLHIEKRMSSR